MSTFENRAALGDRSPVRQRAPTRRLWRIKRVVVYGDGRDAYSNRQADASPEQCRHWRGSGPTGVAESDWELQAQIARRRTFTGGGGHGGCCRKGAEGSPEPEPGG